MYFSFVKCDEMMSSIAFPNINFIMRVNPPLDQGACVCQRRHIAFGMLPPGAKRRFSRVSLDNHPDCTDVLGQQMGKLLLGQLFHFQRMLTDNTQRGKYTVFTCINFSMNAVTSSGEVTEFVK